MKFLDVPLEIKSLAEDGTFSGYGSVWNIQDRQSDIVRRGAFKEIVRNEDGRVVFLWQHDTRQPIGTAAVKEDDYGLHFDGKLVLPDPVAIKAQAHMRAKSVRGVSIGYDTLESNPLSGGVRELTSVRLWELSLVTFPALPEAQVQSVKTLQDCTDEREVKNLLRERDRLSRSVAAVVADAYWRKRQAGGATDDDDSDLEREISRIRNIHSKFKGS